MLAGLALACPDERYCSSCFFPTAKPICRKCFYSAMNPETGLCHPPVEKAKPDCLRYEIINGEFLCRECRFGFFLAENSSCKACGEANCAECSRELGCTTCFHSFRPNAGKCDGSLLCEDSYCDICTERSCKKCQQFYAKNAQGLCVPSLPNCVTLFADLSDKCEECVPGYVITSSRTCEEQRNSVDGIYKVGLLFLSLAVVALVVFLWGWLRHNRPGHYQVSQRDLDPRDRLGYTSLIMNI